MHLQKHLQQIHIENIHAHIHTHARSNNNTHVHTFAQSHAYACQCGHVYARRYVYLYAQINIFVVSQEHGLSKPNTNLYATNHIHINGYDSMYPKNKQRSYLWMGLYA